jgi:hypothetical protein
MAFDGHYYDWRIKRISAIVEHYGAAFFRNCRLLELGAGYGDIGILFHCLGADVTFADARPEHLAVMHGRYPSIPDSNYVLYDAEQRWPFQGSFDLILNMGMIYHTDQWERSIICSCMVSDHVVIETQVSDSDDETHVLKVREAGYDQSVSGIGSRPSPAAVEKVMRNCGFAFVRITDDRCSTSFHHYDWTPTNSGESPRGQRAFWFARRM